MCGISGFYSKDGKFSRQDLEDMAGLMKHRGPDNTAYFFEKKVGFGHNRLSIIDLSEDANQPMHSHDNRFCIVFNGEIYNYKEIANELNLNWKTHSDTEVILDAFAKWGIDFLEKLNGMFAMAIYDKKTENLYLFRDRVGIKPLFYYYDGKNLAFSSELKSVVKLVKRKANLTLSKIAINQFLHLGYIPEPESIYSEIRKFPAGRYAVLENGLFNINRYWRIKEKISNEVITDEVEAKSKFNELLFRSVEQRLISDVPYGTFLSGGIDSSLVTAVAQEITPQPVKTFSIGFKESKFNEANYAKKVADYLKTDHHEFILSFQDAMELIDTLDESYDEPFADSSAIPTMLVSKMAGKYVTMTLSGDGGDELFHGYGAYVWANRLSNPFLKFIRKPVSSFFSVMPSRYERVSYLLNYESRRQLPSHIFSQEQYFFTRHELKENLSSFIYEDYKLKEKHHDIRHSLTPAETQALFDFNYYLKDDLLVKVDRATMKYSLETRVPLLDHKIAEFAVNISPDLKIKNGIQKYLLKQVLYELIPEKYFNRPKWGFAIPMNQWLLNELSYLIDKYLSKNVIEKHGIIAWEFVAKLIHGYRKKNKNYLYNRLWALIVLHKWLEKQSPNLDTSLRTQ